MKAVIKQQLAAPADKEAEKRALGVPHRTESFARGLKAALWCLGSCRGNCFQSTCCWICVVLFAGVIPLRTKLAWGAPAFATSSLTFLIAVYLTDFYVSLVCASLHCSFYKRLQLMIHAAS